MLLDRLGQLLLFVSELLGVLDFGLGTCYLLLQLLLLLDDLEDLVTGPHLVLLHLLDAFEVMAFVLPENCTGGAYFGLVLDADDF